MITFDLSIYKILKNSLIFALLGFKRNFLALVGILALIVVNYGFFMWLGGILMPLGIAMPFIILFSAGSYIASFASYFKIKEIMIDPYMSDESSDEDAPTEEIEDLI